VHLSALLTSMSFLDQTSVTHPCLGCAALTRGVYSIGALYIGMMVSVGYVSSE
jgi:hypothetical protein